MSFKSLIEEELVNIQLQLDEILKNRNLFKEVQQRTIKNSFEHHLANNKQYKDYVLSVNAGVIDNKKFEIEKIPLIPSSLFKKTNINMSSEKNIIKYCTSSGTLGTKSIVPRDEGTLANFLSSISATFPIFLGLEREGNHKVFILGPSTEEAGDLWFSYVLSCMSLNYHTEFMEKNNNFDLNKTMNAICDAIDKSYEILIIAPPFRIVELADLICSTKRKIKLGRSSYIISAGGWKNRQQEAIENDEYIRKVRNAFDSETETFIRDSYNMVELNTVFNECEYGEKHVLPWIEVITRHPKTNHALKDDQVGILSFYDASALSYPGYILSEDFGFTYNGKCKCGRTAKRIKVIRRMNNVEARGCALKMALNINENDLSSNRFYKSYFRNPEDY